MIYIDANHLSIALHQVLKKFFGYTAFRPLQEQIITASIQGKDSISLLPTGGGKSLCFQIPALILPGITLVISPLISLMTDQVDGLRRRGISAVCITSQLDEAEKKQIFDKVLEKKSDLDSAGDSNAIRLLYVSPERLEQISFQKLLKQLDISLIVVDEAHCLSQWGHEFRPSYVRIVKNLAWLRPQTPIAACTATATSQVLAEISQILELKNPVITRASFERKNLEIIVEEVQSKSTKNLLLYQFLSSRILNQSGIIYCATQKGTEYVTALLNYLFDKQVCYTYHAGLDSKIRQQTQTDFIANKIQCIAATNAFGMGVDKPNVRWVVHYDFPGSIEAYYQEIGRAGRDGLHSTCLLLALPDDLIIHKYFLKSTNNPEQVLCEKNLLKKIMEYIESTTCRHSLLSAYFGEELETCGRCDNCEPARKKILEINENQSVTAKIESLYNQAKKQKIEFSFVATQLQQAWMHVLDPKTQRDYLKIPGFGQGWIDTWYNTLHDK